MPHCPPVMSHLPRVMYHASCIMCRGPWDTTLDSLQEWCVGRSGGYASCLASLLSTGSYTCLFISREKLADTGRRS